MLDLSQRNVLVFSGYAREGLIGHLAASIAKQTQGGKLPFIFFADFNTDLSSLANQQWISDLDAVVIKPSGGEISCHKGKGSLIDGTVCSERLQPYIMECVFDTKVPFGPHDGIFVKLATKPGDVMVKSLRPLPNPFLVCKAPCRIPWEAAREKAQGQISYEKRKHMEDLVSFADSVGCRLESEQLSRDLLTWARATEIQEVDRRRQADCGQHLLDGGIYSNRAQPVRFYTKPLRGAKRITKEAYDIPGGLGVLAGFIATLRAITSKLLNAVEAGKSDQHCMRWKFKLVDLAATEILGWKKPLSICRSPRF